MSMLFSPSPQVQGGLMPSQKAPSSQIISAFRLEDAHTSVTRLLVANFPVDVVQRAAFGCTIPAVSSPSDQADDAHSSARQRLMNATLTHQVSTDLEDSRLNSLSLSHTRLTVLSEQEWWAGFTYHRQPSTRHKDREVREGNFYFYKGILMPGVFFFCLLIQFLLFICSIQSCELCKKTAFHALTPTSLKTVLDKQMQKTKVVQSLNFNFIQRHCQKWPNFLKTNKQTKLSH